MAAAWMIPGYRRMLNPKQMMGHKHLWTCRRPVSPAMSWHLQSGPRSATGVASININLDQSLTRRAFCHSIALQSAKAAMRTAIEAEWYVPHLREQLEDAPGV